MTVVRIKQTAPSPSGHIPVAGIIEFTQTKRLTAGENPVAVVQPKTFEVIIDATGEATIELDPTGPDWCWQVSEKKFGAPWEKFWVVVPDQAAADYATLSRVDPRTFDPDAAPEAAWWAALGAMSQGLYATVDPDWPGCLKIVFPAWRLRAPNEVVIPVQEGQ